jgi:hypothetical protein
VTPFGQPALQPEVAVGDPLHGVRDRFVEIVPLDQHGVEPGDRPGRRIPGALEDLGDQREDARRVALGRRRLARGQADLALGLAQARERVHHQQHLPSAVAEILGDRAGELGRPDAEQRRVVAGRDDHHAPPQPLGAEAIFQEFLHFAAALADQRDHGHVRARVLGDRRHQRALADAGAGKNAHALPEPAGVQSIDGADAGRDRPADDGAVERSDAPAVDPARLGRPRRRPAVHGLAEAVQHAAEQVLAAPDPRRDRDVLDPVPPGDAGHAGERHQQRLVLPEADHLRDGGLPAEAVNVAKAPERQREVRRLDRHSRDGLHLPDHAERH